MKSGNLNFLEPSGPLQACNGTALPFYLADKDVSTEGMAEPERAKKLRSKRNVALAKCDQRAGWSGRTSDDALFLFQDLSYKDKHWHEACFLCSKCRVSLVDKQFGSKADKIYCGNCYDAQFASRCDGCGEIFRAGECHSSLVFNSSCLDFDVLLAAHLIIILVINKLNAQNLVL